MNNTKTTQTPAPIQCSGPDMVFGPPLAILLSIIVLAGVVYALLLGYGFLLWQLGQPLLHDPVVWLLSHPRIGGDIGLALATHNGLDFSNQNLNDQLNPVALLAFAFKMFAVEGLILSVFLFAVTALFQGGRTAVAVARRKK